MTMGISSKFDTAQENDERAAESNLAIIDPESFSERLRRGLGFRTAFALTRLKLAELFPSDALTSDYQQPLLAGFGQTTAVVLIQEPSSDLFGYFVETPVGAAKRHEPVIKGKGVPVWALAAYSKRISPDEISKLWLGRITPFEVKMGLLYAQLYPDRVEDKLADDDERQ